MKIEDWEFSWHALSRAVDMCLEEEEIIDALLHPEIIRPTAEYGDTKLYIGGRLGLAVNEGEMRVITIIWRGAADRDLEHDLKRIRDPE